MTFARPTPEQRAFARAAEKAVNMAALALPTRSLHRGTYSGGARGPAPKTTPWRCPALLEMARGRPCLLAIHGICNVTRDTTVACHSNLPEHGKGMSRKADDCYSVWGCAACHRWLDQGPAPADAKRLAFTLAHIDQVQAWRVVDTDEAEPPRFRRAARAALEHLQVSPIVAAP